MIGCNYKFSAYELYGCINDVRNIAILLKTKLGYSDTDITVLVDDGSTEMPSKEVILRHLRSLMNSMYSGDISFIWYSGHGAQLENSTDDGGFNECWCPPDTIKHGTYIIDDTLSEIVRTAPANTTVFIGSDSCHSGTVFDLRYIVHNKSSDTVNRRPKYLFETRVLRSNINITNKVVPSHKTEYNIVMDVQQDDIYKETDATVIALSGCQDFDVSDETSSSIGAMSWAFQQCFDTSITLTDLLHNMRLLLSEFSQVPQLTLGKLLDPNIITFGDIIGIY